jgi:hypothetical protein
LVQFALLSVLPAAAFAQQTTIIGKLVDENRQPLKGAEIRIQSYDPKIQGFGLRTGSDGKFSATTLPPSSYRLTIRVDGADMFVANNIRTRVGDPWRIDFDMNRALVTMSTAHSKKTRRFLWQTDRTGSGSWVETASSDGYETQAERVDRENAMNVMRGMQHGPTMTHSGGQ